mmetsp:Transcript_9761/g.19830  ORF Transcript_9761/g.19830 Transcript_9761/m.19830 type:complete len:231 (-) Transcript_9761:37-729(-)
MSTDLLFFLRAPKDRSLPREFWNFLLLPPTIPDVVSSASASGLKLIGGSSGRSGGRRTSEYIVDQSLIIGFTIPGKGSALLSIWKRGVGSGGCGGGTCRTRLSSLRAPSVVISPQSRQSRDVSVLLVIKVRWRTLVPSSDNLVFDRSIVVIETFFPIPPILNIFSSSKSLIPACLLRSIFSKMYVSVYWSAIPIVSISSGRKFFPLRFSIVSVFRTFHLSSDILTLRRSL